MPGQIQRLAIVFVLFITAFLVVRKSFIPTTFGEHGHYRNAAVTDIASLPVEYAGHQVCADCHDDITSKKKASFHRNVNCEACHGPAAKHIESFDEDEIVFPEVPRDRGHCILCHEYNQAKPTGFPQIDPVAHNPMKPCISCHNPHAPDPPRNPDRCSACHASIARTKALSPHALLECKQCHQVAPEHFSTPRLALPTKPKARKDCSKCHSRSAESAEGIPRSDAEQHGEGYLCRQCHYPHYPEAK